MIRPRLIATLFLATGTLLAGEKTVTLPDMIREMKEQEQTDGYFRAKISDRGELTAVLLLGEFTKPGYLRALFGVTTLESISTGCVPKASVQQMTTLLPSLPHLQKLSVTSPEAQAWNLDFFKSLRGLQQIRQLHLGYATFPVGAIRCLGDLANLEVLELPSAQQLRIADLRELQRCPKLVELNLRGTTVDNSSLSVLLSLKSLRYLDVGRARFSWTAGAVLCAKGITFRSLADHKDVPESPWRPWME